MIHYNNITKKFYSVLICTRQHGAVVWMYKKKKKEKEEEEEEEEEEEVKEYMDKV